MEQYVLVNIMFYTVLIIFSIITCSVCVSVGEFFVEFVSFHGIGNVVIVKEEGSRVDTNLFKELNKMDIKTSVINYSLEKPLEASSHEIMFIILMNNLIISQMFSCLGQDVFSSSNVWLIRNCDILDQVVKEYGSWNESRTNRLLLNDLSLYERRSDLMGYKFQAGTMPEAPYVTIAYDDENSISLGGLWGDIWHGMLGKMMNFSTKIVLSPDR